MQNGLYATVLYSSKADHAHTVQSSVPCSDSQSLWHQRFGHQDKKAIKQMDILKTVSGIDTNKRIHINTFQDYKAGKMTRSTLKPEVLKSKAPGHAIFSDVCEPFPTDSLGGGKYLVAFINGYNSYLST